MEMGKDSIISLAMRRKEVKKVIKLAQKLYRKMSASFHKEDRPPRRGRSKRYSDSLIISLGILKEMFGLSFREALEIAKAYFKEVPSLRDFHYRLSKVEDEIKQLIEYIHDSLQRDINWIQRYNISQLDERNTSEEG